MPEAPKSLPAESAAATASRSQKPGEILVWAIVLREENPVYEIIIGVAREELKGRLDKANELFPNGPLHDSEFARISFCTEGRERAKVDLPVALEPWVKQRAADAEEHRQLKDSLAEQVKGKTDLILAQRECAACVCRAYGRPLGRNTCYMAGRYYDEQIAALERKISKLRAKVEAKECRHLLGKLMPAAFLAEENRPFNHDGELSSEIQQWRAASIEIEQQEPSNPSKFFSGYRKAAAKKKIPWTRDFYLGDFRPLQLEGAPSLVHACYLGLALAKTIQTGAESGFCSQIISEAAALKKHHELALDTQRVIGVVEELTPEVYRARKDVPTKKEVRVAFNDKYRPKVKAGQLLKPDRLANILKSIGLHWLPNAERHPRRVNLTVSASQD